jgi:hypothetical protein
MSDITIFSDHDLFLMGLVLIAPLGILLFAACFLRSSGKPKAANILFILAGVYLLVILGICGGIMAGF